MNKILFITKYVIGVFTFFSLLSSANAATDATTDFAFEEATIEVMEKRVRNISTEVDLRLTGETKRMIKQYTKGFRRGSEHLLGKVSIYFPLFEKVIREKGVPDELKYLSVIESNLMPTATSKHGAAGLWQFMKSTGKMYGLSASSVVDDRRDPEKSTYAAMEYLASLNEQFDDWTLAIAAYNCGPGNIRKAIRRSGSRDYWVLRSYLPKETQDYIPRFVATAYLMNYYQAHDLTPKAMDNDLRYTKKVQVFGKLNLGTLCKDLNLDSKIVKALNPSFLKNYIPKNDGDYYLNLPETSFSQYLVQRSSEEVLAEQLYKKLNFPARTFYEELSAGKYGEFALDITKTVNLEIVKPEIIQELETTVFVENVLPQAVFSSHSKYEYYKLRPGETIIDVANFRRDVTLEEILELNDFVDNQLPVSGDVFRVREL